MQRRNFLKNTILTSAGLMLMPSLPKALASGESISLAELEKEFVNPPGTARPWVFWQWMNGHITNEGITLDLEAMKRMGIGGALCFNNAVGIPRGPVDYASQAWMDATQHAAREAERLGLEFMIHNSPGYSGGGGPWITPEMSMQQLVWTETRVTSKGTIEIRLPKPFAKHHYYRDAFVIAYPSLLVEKALMKDALVRVTMNGVEVDKTIITDGNPDTKIRLESKTTPDLSLLFEFAEPFEARAISILRMAETPRDLFDGPRDHPPLFRLEHSSDGKNFTSIGTIKPPELREMDTPAALSFAPVRAKYYRLSANGPSWVSDVQLYNGPRLGGWPGKTSYTHGNSDGETAGITTELIINPAKVVDLTGKMDSNGRLQWDAPAGNWTILRIGHTTTGEEPAAHPDAGKGLELDKFSRDALDFHFTHFLNKTFDKLQSFKSFKGITVDSWEAGKQNWTASFPGEFRSRTGYDITGWMPALTGRIVGSVEDTERFLWDTRKVQADLLAQNFYGYFKEKCHQRGLQFHAEPYGDGNLDSLTIGQHLDVPMAEFWTRYIYGSEMTSRQAVSIAHAYGRKIAAAEAFTGMPLTAKWSEYPYSLKAEGDWFFTLGINRLVFHVFVHQPYTTGFPGMTMGPFGTHFDRNNTWTEQAYGWLNYVTRAQHLLQQGLSVVDVCYYKGDEPASGIPDTYAILPNGYKGDVIGADVLQNRIKVSGGSIVLPDGMQYRVLMLAPQQTLLPATLRKLKELVWEGMILVVTSKPSGSLGLNHNEQVKQLADELFGNLDGEGVTDRSLGKGKVFWKPIAEVLDGLNIQPDFAYTAQKQDATIHYCHKQVDDAEVYFVSNHKRRKENIVCTFRVNGRQPEIWNAETGEIVQAVLFEDTGGRMRLALELQPAGALFIVFRKAAKNGYQAVLKDGQELFTTQPYPVAQTDLFKDVQNNFTVLLWAKPDTYAHGGKSMLFHAPQGEVVYGAGHVAIGLSAGQNAVRIYERGRGPARMVLESNQPLQGWTHLAVIYQDGMPSLYINGKEAATGKSSGSIVHPGMGTPVAGEQFASYFEGNATPPQLFNEVLSAQQIRQAYEKGLPQPALPPPIDIKHTKDGKLKALFFQNGKYTLKGAATKELGIVTNCAIKEVTGAWKVQFPKGLGAPVEITLPSLISLHQHEDFGVRHFSGRATYLKTITVSKSDVTSGTKLFLHLGRVEVVAEVKVNGKNIGLLWKEPFMVDITEAVRTGSNTLQISVTNLWPNRLIGDEYLPLENEYSEHHFIKKLPNWYVNNQPKPGQRITFSVWKNFEKGDPLLASGLLGPVQLLTAVAKTM